MAGLTDRQQSLIVAISIVLIVFGVMIYATYHNSDPTTVWASIVPTVSGIIGLVSKELGGTDNVSQLANMAQQIVDGVTNQLANMPQQIVDGVKANLSIQQTSSGIAKDTTTANTTFPDTDVGNYQGWEVKIVGNRLNLYPPAAVASVLGSIMSIGSIAGWPANTNWLDLAKPVIDAEMVAYQSAIVAAAKIVPAV